MTTLHNLYIAALSGGASIAVLLFVLNIHKPAAFAYAAVGVAGLVLLAFSG